MNANRPDLSAYGQGGRTPAPVVPVVPERDPIDPRSPEPTTRAPRTPAARPPAQAVVQLNVKVSPEVRDRLQQIRDVHPFGPRATLRDAMEDAINAYWRTHVAGGDPVT